MSVPVARMEDESSLVNFLVWYPTGSLKRFLFIRARGLVSNENNNKKKSEKKWKLVSNLAIKIEKNDRTIIIIIIIIEHIIWLTLIIQYDERKMYVLQCKKYKNINLKYEVNLRKKKFKVYNIRWTLIVWHWIRGSIQI